MRCPNASCRAIFEVHELSSPQPPEKGPGGIGPEKEIRTPQSATDRDILEPIPVGEPIPTSVLMQGGGIPQGTVSVEQVIPLCSAEMVDPGPPMDKTPSMEPTEVPWRLAPPPVRQPSSAQEPPPKAETSTTTVHSVPPASRKSRAEKTVLISQPYTPPPAPDTQTAGPPQPASTTSLSSPPKKRRNEEAAPATPVELPPGTWEPPPIRARKDSDGTVEPIADAAGSMAEEVMTQKKKRRAGCVMGILLLGIGVILAAAGVGVWIIVQRSESHLVDQAQRQYTQKQYNLAASTYRNLVAGYPDSPQVEDYRFLQELTDVLTVGMPLDATADFLDRLKTFLAEHGQIHASPSTARTWPECSFNTWCCF